MTDTAQPELPTGLDAGDRRARFEEELSKVRTKSGGVADEQRYLTIASVVMAAGILLGLASFVISLNQADSRDVMSMLILTAVGVALTIAGSAVFLRYAVGRLLRVWALRLFYESERD